MSLYIACIATGLCVNSPVPIYFELTAEGVYPVSEANSTMVMAFMNNVACLIFLLIFMIPNIGEQSGCKAVSETTTSATATSRSARLPVLKNSRRARSSRSCSRSRRFGHGLINCSQKVRKLFSFQYICYYLILSLYMVYINAKLNCSSLK